MRFSPQAERALQTIFDEHEGEESAALVPLLRAIERAYGFVSDEALAEVARRAAVTIEDAENIASFFSLPRTPPPARFVLDVCHNVNCARRGGGAIMQHLRERLGVAAGEPTPDKRFMLREVMCLGLCQSGPALRVGRELHDGMTPVRADALLDELCARAEEAEDAEEVKQAEQKP